LYCEGKQQLEDLEQLIRECAGNNRRSQEKLYHKFYPALFLLCRKFFRENDEAMEALNDGMVLVFKHIGKYDHGKGEFFNWVYTIVRNAALDKLKKRRWPAYQELNDFTPDRSDPGWSKLEWKDIYKLLDILPPATRVVCCLYYLEEFSIPEISEKLQLRSGTVKWHLSETRNKLRPILAQYYLNK
jgi:RNA polymerase sigma factor (sigma-70 family)